MKDPRGDRSAATRWQRTEDVRELLRPEQPPTLRATPKSRVTGDRSRAASSRSGNPSPQAMLTLSGTEVLFDPPQPPMPRVPKVSLRLFTFEPSCSASGTYEDSFGLNLGLVSAHSAGSADKTPLVTFFMVAKPSPSVSAKT